MLIVDGLARGPAEMPPGELQLPAPYYAELAERMREAGYAVCPQPIDEQWIKAWKKGRLLADHWNEEARLVRS